MDHIHYLDEHNSLIISKRRFALVKETFTPGKSKSSSYQNLGETWRTPAFPPAVFEKLASLSGLFCAGWPEDAISTLVQIMMNLIHEGLIRPFDPS